MYAKKCECGAVTVEYHNDAGEEVVISMPEDLFNEHFPGVKLEEDTYGNCDYCVNHYGIDLCGCGSGEKVGECDGEFNECLNNIPSQTLDVRRERVDGGCR